MILPLNCIHGHSRGEDHYWAKCREYLPQDYVSFHNYYLELKEVDNIILVPEKGVLITEIKGFSAKTILDAPDNNTIRRSNGTPPEPSPLKQADRYRYKLIDDFLIPNGIDSVYVISAVCYPFISEAEYYEKHLDKISHRIITILREDLASKEAFLKRVDEIFDFSYKNIMKPGLKKNGFTAPLLDKVGNLISRDFRGEGPGRENKESESEGAGLEASEPIPEGESVLPVLSDQDYSILAYSNDGSEFSEETVSQYIADWRMGTRVQLFSSSNEAIAAVTEQFKNAVGSFHVSNLPQGTADPLALNNGTAFRLEIGLVKGSRDSFIIRNGVLSADGTVDLKWLDEQSAFNYGQYCMEHAPLENIIVKAGAGTGKTFSLISRINYLIWKERLSPSDLPEKIAMITFTNDSANQMKEALAKNFLNYYHLTGNPLYLEYIDAVEDTHISTIDSLARAILSKYAIKLGLGVNFRIVTGTYERSLLLRQALNEFLLAEANEETSIPMTMFHFEQRLNELMNKLDNKNIDLANDFDALEFGGGAKQLPDGVLNALRGVQKELNADLGENNAVALGDLIRKLRQLTNVLQQADLENGIRIKYLFVDEFQDTDDVQIELIHRFQQLIGFKYFVVGDTKQCIYRFRGAEVKAFDTLKNMDHDAPVHVVSLRKNYRTDTGLLKRMNQVFGAWNQDGDLEYQGDDVLIGTKNYSEKPLFVLHAGDLRSDDRSILIQTIKEAQEEAKKGEGKVAILVRFNAQIKTIQEVCAEEGISVGTDVGGELFSADPTIDLFKLLMALRYNQSPAHLYNLYTTSFVSKQLPKKRLLGLGSDELVRVFYENPPIERWKQYLEQLRCDPILKVLQTVIQDIMPWDIFAKSSSENPEEQNRNRFYYTRNLDQLFENLLRISNTDYLTLNKLTDYLELMILTRQEADAREPFGIEASDGSLICTTVHKAKGLQYDAVILPFCDFDIACKRDRGTVDLVSIGNKVGYRILTQDRKEAFVNDIYMDFQKDERVCRQHEETRILYVALTRAKRAVYCITPIDDKRRSLTWSDKLKEKLECEF